MLRKPHKVLSANSHSKNLKGKLMHVNICKNSNEDISKSVLHLKSNNKEKLTPGMQKIQLMLSKHTIKKKSQHRVIIFIIHFWSPKFQSGSSSQPYYRSPLCSLWEHITHGLIYLFVYLLRQTHDFILLWFVSPTIKHDHENNTCFLYMFTQ